MTHEKPLVRELLEYAKTTRQKGSFGEPPRPPKEPRNLPFVFELSLVLLGLTVGVVGMYYWAVEPMKLYVQAREAEHWREAFLVISDKLNELEVVE